MTTSTRRQTAVSAQEKSIYHSTAHQRETKNAASPLQGARPLKQNMHGRQMYSASWSLAPSSQQQQQDVTNIVTEFGISWISFFSFLALSIYSIYIIYKAYNWEEATNIASSPSPYHPWVKDRFDAALQRIICPALKDMASLTVKGGIPSLPLTNTYMDFTKTSWKLNKRHMWGRKGWKNNLQQIKKWSSSVKLESSQALIL